MPKPQGQVEQLNVTPVIEDDGWAGYQHFTDPTRLPFNVLTYPSVNCSMPSSDKIVPDIGKLLLGQQYTENQPIIGNKEKFTNLAGDELEVRVSHSNLALEINTIVGIFKFNEVITGSVSGATATIISINKIDAFNQELIIQNIFGTFQHGETVTGATSGATGVITLDNTHRRDIIEILYTDINPQGAFYNQPHWYTITSLSNNTLEIGLHRYSFDQWLDTHLNPAKNLNSPRLIWVNGNKKVYCWIGGIASIVDVTGSYLSIDVGILALNSIGGAFVKGEIITGGISGATAVIGESSNLTSPFRLIQISGTFSDGETVTGGTSGATGVVLSYTAPTLNWQQLGFFDPSVSGFADDAKINVNDTIRTISAGWATATVTVAPTLPTMHVGDIAFSIIRSDDVPFYADFCRQTKNYMYYGNWQSRQLYQSNAFNHDSEVLITNSDVIAGPLGSGTGLDDMYIPATSYYTGTQSEVFKIVIDNDVSNPNEFAWYRNGVYVADQNIDYTMGQDLDDGAQVRFLSNIDHTLNSWWEATAYPEVQNAWVNFYYTLPVRQPGEGYIFRLPSNFWTMDVQEDKMYINTQYGEWSILDTELSADQTNETIILTPLKQDGALKVIDPWMTGHMEDNLVFVTLDKFLMNMGRQAFLQEPQDAYMSDPVKYDFLPCDFIGGSIREIGMKLFITSPNQGIMHCLDVAKKYWQPPKTFIEMGILSAVENELICHSNIRNQSFTLFKSLSDNGQSYQVVAKTPFNAYFKIVARKKIPARWDSKFSNTTFVEGYITGNPQLTFTAFLGVNDSVGQSHTILPVITNNPSDKASIGEGSLAVHPLGDDLAIDGNYFNEMYNQFKPIMTYYFIALQISCIAKNHSYSILGMGVNMSFSPTSNNPLFGTREIL